MRQHVLDQLGQQNVARHVISAIPFDKTAGAALG
jgi:hypothetical protein